MSKMACLSKSIVQADMIVPVTQSKGHEIEGGCPTLNNIEAPVTVEKLAEAGEFDPASKRCLKCQKNVNYKRCMKIYAEMDIAEKIRIDSILESREGGVKRDYVECKHRVPVAQ